MYKKDGLPFVGNTGQVGMKLEKHALNKALVGDQDKLPEHIQKEILAKPEDNKKSKDPLNYGSTPTFNRQYNSVEPTAHAQMDMAQIFQNYGNQMSQSSGDTAASTDSTTDTSTDISLVGETPQSLRMQERTKNTAARIAQRDARKKERGGGTRVGNFLRNTFN